MIDTNTGFTAYAHEDLWNVATNYFSKLYLSGDIDITTTIHHVDKKINDDDNSILLEPFTLNEFKMATFQMHNYKFPWPNGLNPTFYRKF